MHFLQDKSESYNWLYVKPRRFEQLLTEEIRAIQAIPAGLRSR
jgi:hypothetical protein